MSRFTLLKAVMAALMGFAVLAAPPPASAGFKVSLAVDGGPATILSWSGTTDPSGDKQITYSGSLNHVNILFTVSTSNQSGGPDYGSIARIDVSGVQITNLDTAEHKLVIKTTDTDFNFPVPPLIVHTTASSTVTNTQSPITTKLNFLGEVDKNNTEFGDSFDTGPGIEMDYAGGLGTTASGSLSRDAAPFNPTGLYSVTGVYAFDLGGKANVVSAGGTVEIITPTPASFVLAAIGLPFLGLGYLRGRRRMGS